MTKKERDNLERQRQNSKTMRRLRARFEGRYKDKVRQPGYTFEGGNGEAIKAWIAAW